MMNKAHNLKRTFKKKSRGNIKIGPASVAMIELLTVMFLKNLSEEAKAQAFAEKSATIKAQHIKAVSKKVLKKARG